MWCALLRNASLQTGFHVNCHSDLVIPAERLVAALLDEITPNALSFALLHTFAKALVPPEFCSRIISSNRVADASVFHSLIEQKASFFILPSSELFIGTKLLLLFGLVLFPSPEDVDQRTCFWSFCCEMRTPPPHNEDIDANILTRFMGVLPSLFGACGMQWRQVQSILDAPPTSNSLLLVLFSLRACIMTLAGGGSTALRKRAAAPVIWPVSLEELRTQLLASLLLAPGVSLRLAPLATPFPTPHRSLLDAMRAFNVGAPRWCADFREENMYNSMLEAVRDVTKTVVLTVRLGEPLVSEVLWARRPSDQQVLLLAERGGNLGGVLYLRDLTPALLQAKLSLLAPLGSFSALRLNRVIIKYANPFVVIQVQPGDTIEVTVDGTPVCLRCN